MSAIKVKITGLKQLNKNLKKLTGREATNIMRAGTRAAAVAIKNSAAKNLPGEHKRKIDVASSRRESSKIRHVFRVGPKADHWALAFLEYGVPAHDITPKTKKVLANIGGDFVAGSVKHPGVRKTAWLSKAFNESTSKAIDAFNKRVNDRIKKALLKR